MASPRTLRVYPNPYLHVDAEGRPCAIVPYEPANGNDVAMSKRFVGMTMKHAITFTAPRDAKGNIPSGQQDVQSTWFEPTSDEPVELPDTAYYRAAIRAGELIPADEATNLTTSKKHVEASKVLADHRDAAAKKFALEQHEHHTDEHRENVKKHVFGPMDGVKELRAAEKAKAEKAKAEADAAAKKQAADAAATTTKPATTEPTR